MTSEVIKGHKHIRLWTDFDENCMNANIMKTQIFHKCHFYVMEKFCGFLRPF